MCGIVGYVGPRDAAPILLDGLRRLEYRGYDSAGIALLTDEGDVFVEKKAGKLSNLTEHLNGSAPAGHPGIAHTRWATHGRPNDVNAHPHTDCSGKLALIHNGIIENYSELKDRLLAEGHRFTSETDTEVLAHLIESRYDGDLVEAVRLALNEVRGAYAIGVMHHDHPDRIVGARMNVPLIVGLGKGEGFLASDVPAILEHTKNVVILDEGDIADVTADGVRILQMDGQPVERDVTRIRWGIEAAEKGGFAHFTLKEIYEQPHAIQEALRGRVDAQGHVSLPELDAIEDRLLAAERIYVVGCGTARIAADVGAYLIQEWAGLPASAQIGSEMRYSPPPIDDRTVVISVSQSGETADTLAPTRLADERGATIVVVTNVVGSALTRDADAVCYLQAGPEVAVASTKAFVTQVIVLELIALRLAQLRGRLSAKRVSAIGMAMRELPRLAAETLKLAPQIKKLAMRWNRVRNVMYIGRALGFPVAMEGALKLKELSYVHAEGYAAGELKHGPIALLDHDTPLVAVATRSATYEKVTSNVAEVRAREAPVVAVATEGDEEIARYAQDVLYVPDTLEQLSPILAVLPLQLLAYEVAVARGTDVDQPRNLAKSVTVE
ncbi:MAG TPA: glutamine--fructose-6-phosphate transaminase (isomerizing) [Candidatus Limnocylindria bacterium]|jgi:glucosamine--fructose-6-phosphate aminotransferase (isomerizing)|nr:glutamine--fructose-6-phosphate transaminase (isomerizing) [Candidatus Limnocylindria bacterium]